MTDELPTVIASTSDLPGLGPGESEVEFDSETGIATVVSGPGIGQTFRPADHVTEAMRSATATTRARRAITINTAVEKAARDSETPEGER